MHPTGITANLPVADLAEARQFYVDFLGLSDEGFNLGWVMRLSSPDGRAVVQLVTRDATSPVDSHISCPRRRRGRGGVRGGTAARPRDRPPADRGALGRTPVLRAGAGRQCHQHRQPQGLTREEACGLGHDG